MKKDFNYIRSVDYESSPYGISNIKIVIVFLTLSKLAAAPSVSTTDIFQHKVNQINSAAQPVPFLFFASTVYRG